MRKVNVSGLNVVVSGRIAGESRVTAEAKLRDAGAHVHPSVTGTTHLLVTGAAVGETKRKAAVAKGAKIVPWENVSFDGSGAALDEVEDASGSSPGRPLASRPAQIAPMLALAGGQVPKRGDEWLFEVKWDGIRAVAVIENGRVGLQSRSGKTDLTPRYPEVVKALEGLDDCILDGEIVVLDKKGASKFQALIGKSSGRARMIVFDVLAAEGVNVRGEPLSARKLLVTELLRAADSVYVAESPVFQDGELLLRCAEEQGFEGIVAKRTGSTYQEGRRGPDWLKFKVRNEQEFVVVGYTPGEGSLEGMFGALVLGVHDESGKLVYAGKVGTGFDLAERRRLGKLLRMRTAPPVALTALQAKSLKDVLWVMPKLVVQVAFQRWTPDGVLWHPSYRGERIDKEPGDVVREPCSA